MAQVIMDYETAEIICRVFLPKNENKMRAVSHRVVEAVKEFKRALAASEAVYGVKK